MKRVIFAVLLSMFSWSALAADCTITAAGLTDVARKTDDTLIGWTVAMIVMMLGSIVLVPLVGL